MSVLIRCVEELKVNVLSIDLNKAFYLTLPTLCSVRPCGCCLHLLARFSFNRLFGSSTWPRGEASPDFIHYITLLDYIEYSRKCSTDATILVLVTEALRVMPFYELMTMIII